jgi:2-dehydro-3-deoxygluconokinase
VPDLVTFGDAAVRLSPPVGERIETVDGFSASVWGPESNVAVAAATLGADAVWLSKLADTPVGRRVVRELRGHGVRTGVAWTDDGRTATAFLERGGGRGARSVPDREGTPAATATAADLPGAPIRAADALFVSGATAGRSETLLETTTTLFDAAGDAGATRAFDARFEAADLSPADAKRCYEHVLDVTDVFVVGATAVRTVFDAEGEAVAVGHQLRERYDLSTVVVTPSNPTAATVGIHRDTVSEVAPVEVECRDPAGAHDAFVGGFLAGRLAGDGIDVALENGAAAAAFARTVVGDVVVGTADDVAAFRTDGS